VPGADPHLLRRMDRAALLPMLTREQELRDSDEVQREYDAHELPPETIEERLQLRVLSEHGFAAHELPAALQLYQLTNWRFPHDAELRSCVVYLRADVSSPGDLAVGDEAPDAALHDAASGAPTSLHRLTPSDGRMLVVAAGSAS